MALHGSPNRIKDTSAWLLDILDAYFRLLVHALTLKTRFAGILSAIDFSTTMRFFTNQCNPVIENGDVNRKKSI